MNESRQTEAVNFVNSRESKQSNRRNINNNKQNFHNNIYKYIDKKQTDKGPGYIKKKG